MKLSLAPLAALIAACGSQVVHFDHGPNDDAEGPIGQVSSAATTLAEVKDFGTNPGALDMFEYVPAKVAATPATVVVMHGCSQTAAEVAATGWTELADELGFVVVLPQQRTANNAMKCFNWAGEYGDTANLERGKGENQSIKEMVDKSIAAHKGDAKKVYAVGFSGGGGEAALLAAVWPDVFAGIATIAGIPFHCTTTFSEVYTCLKPGKTKTAAEHADFVKQAHAGFAGPYPRVSIWQGADDQYVAPMNRAELVKQWTQVHGISQTPSATETVDGAKREVFKKADGTVLVESFEVPGMQHGVAIAPGKKCGTASTYALDKNICTARHVATFFGLTGGAAPATGKDAGPGTPGGGSSSSSTGGPQPGGNTPGGNGGPAAPAPGGPEREAADSTCSIHAPRSNDAAWSAFVLIALALVAVARRSSSSRSSSSGFASSRSANLRFTSEAPFFRHGGTEDGAHGERNLLFDSLGLDAKHETKFSPCSPSSVSPCQTSRPDEPGSVHEHQHAHDHARERGAIRALVRTATPRATNRDSRRPS